MATTQRAWRRRRLQVPRLRCPFSLASRQVSFASQWLRAARQHGRIARGRVAHRAARKADAPKLRPFADTIGGMRQRRLRRRCVRHTLPSRPGGDRSNGSIKTLLAVPGYEFRAEACAQAPPTVHRARHAAVARATKSRCFLRQKMAVRGDSLRIGVLLYDLTTAIIPAHSAYLM